jgi:hypothetical protein
MQITSDTRWVEEGVPPCTNSAADTSCNSILTLSTGGGIRSHRWRAYFMSTLLTPVEAPTALPVQLCRLTGQRQLGFPRSSFDSISLLEELTGLREALTYTCWFMTKGTGVVTLKLGCGEGAQSSHALSRNLPSQAIRKLPGPALWVFRRRPCPGMMASSSDGKPMRPLC